MVACIDFSGSWATLPTMETCTAEIIDKIKRKKYQDKHCLYLLHRVRLPTLCDPFVREHFKRRMSEAVNLLKRELLPGNGTVKEQELPPSEANWSAESVPDAYTTWCEHTLVSERHDVNSLWDQVRSGSFFWYGPEMYSMTLQKRGLCIIINNRNFKDAAGQCHGSKDDVRRMYTLFKAFLFKPKVYIDETADRMKAILSEAAQSKEQERAECLVVILMSHENQDTIQDVHDAKLNLMNDVYAPFNNEKCPALKGKPKLFFIQTCRGNSKQPVQEGPSVSPCERATSVPPTAVVGTTSNEEGSGASITKDVAADSVPEAAEESQLAERTATWSDMYIAYAVISGHSALRDENIGSWFLSAVFTVFSNQAPIEHLDRMMELVHAEILQNSAELGHGQTPTVQKYGWCKYLYFNPKYCLSS